MAGLSEWRGFDRYGEDILLFKFDWRDAQVLAWIDRFTKIAGEDTLGNVERQKIKRTGRLMRSLYWKTWAVAGGEGQVFDARYVYYAKFVELALGKGNPFTMLPPNIPGARWQPIRMPDGRKRRARPHVVTEMRSQARKFTTFARRHFMFKGTAILAFSMGSTSDAAAVVNRAALYQESDKS